MEERRLTKKFKSKGHTLHYIANCLDRSFCFVHNALKPHKSNDGRRKSNKKTSETTDNIILTLVKRAFMLSRQIVCEINNEVCSRTLRRWLRGANLLGRIARRLPLLRPHHLSSSLQFGKRHISNDYARNVRRPKGMEFHFSFTKKTF